MRNVLAALPLLITAPAFAAETPVKNGTVVSQTYVCERGVEVPVSYINVGETSLAVVSVDGKLVTMQIETSGSGSRYISLDEQNGYRWHTNGQEALLFHLAADHTAKEERVLSNCRVMED